MSDKKDVITLIEKSFYVLSGDNVFKQTFCVFEDVSGKKWSEENVYGLKESELEFDNTPIESRSQEVGESFVSKLHEINFGNFYCRENGNISISAFLKYIFLKNKNKKLSKQVLEIAKSKDVLDMPFCIPKDVITNFFPIECE